MKSLLLLIALLPIFATANDVSLYRGLATTHLFMDNSQLNNDNGVTILKIDNVLLGTMTNSYGESGRFLGYQSKVLDWSRFEGYVGLTLVDGYKRWQMPLLRSNANNYADNVLMLLPIASLSFDLTNSVALQLNNMSGIVLNVGVRIDF